jgi:hypothetical protein
MEGDLENIISHKVYYEIFLEYIKSKNIDYENTKKIIDDVLNNSTAHAFAKMSKINTPLPVKPTDTKSDKKDNVIVLKDLHEIDALELEIKMNDMFTSIGQNDIIHFYFYDSPNEITHSLINAGRAFNDTVLNRFLDLKEFRKIPCFYKTKFSWIYIFKLYGFVKVSEIQPAKGLREFMMSFKKYNVLTPVDIIAPSDFTSREPQIYFNDNKVNVEKLRKNVLHTKML